MTVGCAVLPRQKAARAQFGNGGRPKPVRDIDPRRRRMPAEFVDVVGAAGKILGDALRADRSASSS